MRKIVLLISFLFIINVSVFAGERDSQELKPAFRTVLMLARGELRYAILNRNNDELGPEYGFIATVLKDFERKNEKIIKPNLKRDLKGDAYSFVIDGEDTPGIEVVKQHLKSDYDKKTFELFNDFFNNYDPNKKDSRDLLNQLEDSLCDLNSIRLSCSNDKLNRSSRNISQIASLLKREMSCQSGTAHRYLYNEVIAKTTKRTKRSRDNIYTGKSRDNSFVIMENRRDKRVEHYYFCDVNRGIDSVQLSGKTVLNDSQYCSVNKINSHTARVQGQRSLTDNSIEFDLNFYPLGSDGAKTKLCDQIEPGAKEKSGLFNTFAKAFNYVFDGEEIGKETRKEIVIDNDNNSGAVRTKAVIN